jgi:hypothetical protein
MWYQGPIWVGSLDAIIRISEQLDEVGLSLGFFCCWLCGSNQALWSRFVPTFGGHWHWFQIWCVLFFQVLGGLFPRPPHHAIDLKFEYKYGAFSLKQHIWARHLD